MKWSVRHTCGLIFAALTVAVFLFLQQFTVSGSVMRYIQWEKAAHIFANGTEEAFDITEYAPPEEPDGSVYRFTATLPEGLADGYLLFETSGLELTLYWDGEEIYSSSVAAPEDTTDMSQAHIPLPPDAAGRELMALCRPLGGNAIFPPLMRYTSDSALERDAMAYANLRGIPSGAFGLAFVLICGLFLLGFVWKKPDWSLIPLIVAALGMLMQPVAVTIGHFFLPEGLYNILAWRGFYLVILAAFLAYFLMNRRRDFRRLFGLAALVSAGALAVCYLLSLWRGSYLAGYVNSELEYLFTLGVYSGIAFWLTFWMVLVCAAISAYTLLRAVAQTRADTQAVALREQLAIESYRQLESKLRETGELRHEARHQLTALDALYRKGDMDALGAELGRLTELSALNTPIVYTENVSINVILQNAAAQAAELGVRFEALALTPKELPIPETDPCSFMMNMLDNAVEANRTVSDVSRRFINFRVQLQGNFLAFRCENAYAGSLSLDINGLPQTTKSQAELHGFGMRQMRRIAEKYGSILDFSCTDDSFTAQTALCISND